MSLDDLLAELSVRGIVIAANGDKLRVVAKPGVVTVELRKRLADHKAALLAHLTGSMEPKTLPEIMRIPLDANCSPSDWLAERGLKIVGGTPHSGGQFRPMLFVKDISSTEAKTREGRLRSGDTNVMDGKREATDSPATAQQLRPNVASGDRERM